MAKRKTAVRSKAKPARASAAKKSGKKKAAPSRMEKMGATISHAAAKVAAEAKAVVARVGARRAKRQANLLHLVGAESLAKKADKRAAGRKSAAARATKAAARV